MRDFGIKNVVIRNMIDYAKQNRFQSESEVHESIRNCISLLENSSEEITNHFLNSQNCSHEYNETYFTVRKVFTGEFVTVYERTCSKCGFTEYERDKKPDWAKNAKERYYNNDI
mgnify:CR=1 FL=1